MIRQLNIRHYALIGELEIPFSEGMTVITGETGAGKSILLGALSLLLGNRADSSMVATGQKKCIIEAVFSTADYPLHDFFEAYDIDRDHDNETIIRREISIDGKSRAFVNDTPVNISALRELGSLLIEIHSQHETLTLNRSDFQMMVLDHYAGNSNLLSDYRALFKSYTIKGKKLDELKAAESKAAADRDYIQFLFDELHGAKLKTGEQPELERELEILKNSENILSSLHRSLSLLNGDDQNILQALRQVVALIQPNATFHEAIAEILKRLNTCQIELIDIASELDHLSHTVNPDPMRSEVVGERLDQIYRLQQKHRLNSVEELMAKREELDTKLHGFTTLTSEIAILEKEREQLLVQLRDLTNQLRANRQKAIPGIEKEIRKLLTELGMKNAELKISLLPLAAGDFNETGSDRVQFLFSANKGSEFRELHKVASGGELSRLMLAVKSILASLKGLPTIIFDEIDTGISGEVAHKVGNILKLMSQERQVIAITHLPQMAGKGDEHLLVFKLEKAGRTQTQIKVLTKEDRVLEIARMLSGEKPTKAAMANARELLES